MGPNRTDGQGAGAAIVPVANETDVLIGAVVGAVSVSLRVVLDALAGVAHGRPVRGDLSRFAFAGLGLFLVTTRSFVRAADAGVRSAFRAGGATIDALPGGLRGRLDDRVDGFRDRARARDAELARAEVLAEDLFAALVPRLVEAMLDQIDLTTEVVRRVDIDRVAAGIDVDAIAARLDPLALVERIDLPSLARTVIDEIDLPEIIRRSTGLVASETVRGVRMQGIGADGAIAAFVDRALRRQRPRGGTDEPGGDPSSSARGGGAS